MREDHGVDLTKHRSAMLSETDVLEATHIYCMAQRHQDAVLTLKKRMAASRSSQHGLGSSLSSLSTLSSCSNLTEGADDGGDGKKTLPPPRASLVVSVFNPEVPDPWHGTIEFYRECTEMISTAVTKVLDEDISVVSNSQQQQQADGVPADLQQNVQGSPSQRS